MKLVTFASFLFFAAFGLASPTAGEKSVYLQTVTQNGAVVSQMELAFLIKSVDGGGNATVSVIARAPNGVAFQQDATMHFMSTTEVQTVLANCAMMKGQISQATVQNVTLQTCKLSNLEVALVPMGYVSASSVDPATGKTTTLVLQSYELK
jgi:hypothetical protein